MSPTPATGDNGFVKGMNSQVHPAVLPSGAYWHARNTLCRGGVISPRPGMDLCFKLPEGEFQGAHVFRRDRGFSQILFVVSGRIFVSDRPFDAYRELTDFTFAPYAKQVFFADGEKAYEKNEDGSLRLIDPHGVCLLQDGFSAPLSWDGGRLRRLTGESAPPVGTVMRWSGNRMWVASGLQLYASDPFNPELFDEEQYFGNARSFTFLDPIVALSETTVRENAALLVHTTRDTYGVATALWQRDQWALTQGFISKVFPNVGIVGSRAFAFQNGLLWWMSPRGLVNLDSARSTSEASELPILDAEMSVGKQNDAIDYSDVRMGAAENLLLVSVPTASRTNEETWVLDASPVSTVDGSAPRVWSSIWDGFELQEWLPELSERGSTLHAIVRQHGESMLVRMLQEQPKDLGSRLVWMVETRAYEVGVEYRLGRAEFRFVGVQGRLDYRIYVVPTNSPAINKIAEGTLRVALTSGALIGEVGSSWPMATTPALPATVHTPEDPSAITVCAPIPPNVDLSFRFVVVVQGRASLAQIRLWATPEAQAFEGGCPPDASLKPGGEDAMVVDLLTGVSTGSDTFGEVEVSAEAEVLGLTSSAVSEDSSSAVFSALLQERIAAPHANVSLGGIE